MPRLAAKRILGTKLKAKKVKKTEKTKTKIKLKIKGTPSGVMKAVKKVADTDNDEM